MKLNGFTVQCPMVLGGSVNEAEVLGACVWPLMHSASHRSAPRETLPASQLALIIARQYQNAALIDMVAVTPGVGITHVTLATSIREERVRNSFLLPGIIDGGKVYSNVHDDSMRAPRLTGGWSGLDIFFGGYNAFFAVSDVIPLKHQTVAVSSGKRWSEYMSNIYQT